MKIKDETKTNEYTDMFKGKNILLIHAESIQNFTLNTSFNGVDVAPNLKKLASEGLYFSNFYAQESVGTSSDSEFTLSTSLMPASSGTVFVSYWDREYETLQKLLKNKGIILLVCMVITVPSGIVIMLIKVLDMKNSIVTIKISILMKQLD